MKERITSALVGLVILAVVVFFYETILFNIVIAAISVLAVYELLNATKTIQYKGMSAVVALFSFLLPFVQRERVRPWAPVIVFAILVLFLLVLLKNHATLKYEKAAMMLFFGMVVPLFLSCTIYLRDHAGAVRGLYYLLLALGSAWLCDSGAYFAGYFFGKHKMSPNVSPKKTVEGAIGGVIVAVVLNLALAVGYAALVNNLTSATITINYWIVGLASFVLAGLGMLGDLTASVLKRQYDVKDFGHIMPGHGGIMDRFDSVLLTLPAVYILTIYLPVAI